MRHDAVEWHALAANSLLIVAGLHAAAALWHQFVRKDGVLRRMWPAKD
ncbi:MAG TPA: cytochrome b/b6 domain-containing protein [Burkholderiaceae bacterium]